jgi:hypothetical protein
MAVSDMGMFVKTGLNHFQGLLCIHKTLIHSQYAQKLSKKSIDCIQRDKCLPQRQSGNWMNTMHLQFLEFDCSEDAEGVACWDALAQPAARHTQALLQEVAQVLTWAHHWSPRDPGAIEDGADWDFDVHLHVGSVAIPTHWNGLTQTLVLSSALHGDEAVTLSLSISGTPAFSAAFREHWNTP